MFCGREESSPVFGVSGELAAVRQGDHVLVGAERRPRQQGDCREGRDGLGTLHLCSIGKTARDRSVLFCCFGCSLYMFANAARFATAAAASLCRQKRGRGRRSVSAAWVWVHIQWPIPSINRKEHFGLSRCRKGGSVHIYSRLSLKRTKKYDTFVHLPK